jgi:GNAT superfamily N-acetyltransferase
MSSSTGRLRRGRNPGHADAAVFWATDPQGFVGVHRDGELAGAGAIVSYGGRFGFLGLFIVRPELRGRGLGRRLWLLR